MVRSFNKLVVVGVVALLFSVMGHAGTFEDPRDGKTYKTVKIGNQTWMAENLKVRTEGSWCYKEELNCQKYGRFYRWFAAQVACPAGWHLPSKGEFETLLKAVGGTRDETNVFVFWRGAGVSLKSTTGWKWNGYEGKSGNGDDPFGFSALPAGNGNNDGRHRFEGDFANFWSSTETYGNGAYHMKLYYSFNDAFLEDDGKNNGFSVRCLKDNPVEPKSSSSFKKSSSSFKDSRDGKTYKTVKIGNQTWMAENLKERTEGSWCYEDKESNCQKYGRLYSWDAAKSACPAGWHLPSKGEFEALFVAVGGEDVAGKKLKSASGWKNDDNGDDPFGFSALPAGRRYYYGDFSNEGDNAYFWSSTEGSSYGVYYVNLNYNDGNAHQGYDSKYFGFSVRCLKD